MHMALIKCENLPGPLEYVAASYRDARSRPVRRVAAAKRADQLATYVALSLDEPSGLQKLQDAAAELGDAPYLAAVLPQVAMGAITLMGADFGNVQVVDPRDGSLVLVTQLGFSREFLDHFAVVHDNRSVCGRAARQGAQAVVDDVRTDPAFTPHREVFRAAGVRAIQSTPLVDGAGQMIGMISTHTSQAGWPSARDLQIMEIYGQLAGEAIARHLGCASADGDRGDPRHDGAVPAWLELDQAAADPHMIQIMSDTINRISSVGLSLAGALKLITNDLAAQRVQIGIDELDEAIQSIHLAALARSVHHDLRNLDKPRAINGGPRPRDPTVRVPINNSAGSGF